MSETLRPGQHYDSENDAQDRPSGMKRPVLSKRLERILSMIRPGALLADIGTDHAYVPIAAVDRGLCDMALACDIIPGPLERARANIEAAGLADRIEIRQGDGLEALGEDCPDCIVIAGMGGSLMGRILREGWERLENSPQLVLSPQSEWMEFRRFLIDHDWMICREAMVEEDGKYYLILDCENGPVAGTEVKYAELRYGAHAVYDPGDLPVRREYIQKDLQTARSILSRLKKNHSPAAAARREALEELIGDALWELGEGDIYEGRSINERSFF